MKKQPRLTKVFSLLHLKTFGKQIKKQMSGLVEISLMSDQYSL